MASCPLCSDILLRHIRSGKTYWLCRRCRLEILEKSDPTHNSEHTVLPGVAIDAIEWLPTAQYDDSINHTRRQFPPIKTEA